MDCRIGSKFANIIRYRWEAFQSITRYFIEDRRWDHLLSPLVRASRLVTATTTTAYPDPNPETTTTDGNAYQNSAGTDWTSLRNSAGNAANDTNANDFCVRIDSTAVSTLWAIIVRSIFLFDTSSIPDTDTVSAATMSLYGTGQTDNLAITPNINLYTSTPASNTAIANGDYAQVAGTAKSTAITYAGWSITGYNDFALSDLTIVSQTGVTKLGVRNAAYDVANSSPTWGSNTFSQLKCYFADQTGTTNDPKLVVTHAAAAAAVVGPKHVIII